METKMCGKCKQEKPLSEFYRRGKSWQARCKVCQIADSRVNNRNPARRLYNKQIQTKMQKDGYFKRYYQRPEVRQRRAAQMREYRNNPALAFKHAARDALNKAKKHGKIQQQPCFRCGKPKTEGHHPDYNKPLLVVWLCPECHRVEHAKAQS